MPYFDYNATTPLSPASRDAWVAASDAAWQNPASPYRDAARVKALLGETREQLSELLGCSPERVVFTSGATEASNAVLAHLRDLLSPTLRIAVNPTEHPCVIESAQAFAPERRTRLRLSSSGELDLAALEQELHGGRLGAVVAMAANNETGVLFPWTQIAALCRNAGVAFVCDATQWLGKMPAKNFGAVDWLFGSAHKFGGPKGTGFLVKPARSSTFHIQRGGAQQQGARAGTEDYPNAAALVAALAESEKKAVAGTAAQLAWRRQFEEAIAKNIPGCRVIAPDAPRLWNTVSLVLPHSTNLQWVLKLDRQGFQISTGSACSTGKEAPSHVLEALGFSLLEARRVVRISAGWQTSETDWKSLAAAFSTVDKDIRADNPNVIVL